MPGDQFTISAHERGVVRVFTTDLEPESSAAITANNVHRLLGEGLELDAKRIEVFPTKAVEAIGLAGYLTEGYGIPPQDLKGRGAALDALQGLVVLVASGAFNGKAAVLNPSPALRFLGAFYEPGMAPPVAMEKPISATGNLSGTSGPVPAKPRARVPWALPLGALLMAAALVLFLVL